MINGISIINGEDGFPIHIRRSKRDQGWTLTQGTSWLYVDDDAIDVLPRVASLLKSGDLAELVEEGLVSTAAGADKQLGRLYSSKSDS